MIFPFLLSCLVNGVGGMLAAQLTANLRRGGFPVTAAILLIPTCACVGLNIMFQNTIIELGLERSELTWLGMIFYIMIWIYFVRRINLAKITAEVAPE